MKPHSHGGDSQFQGLIDSLNFVLNEAEAGILYESHLEMCVFLLKSLCLQSVEDDNACVS